jgi:hypothetical protein
MNLITQALSPSRSVAGSFPVSLTLRPACGVPGEYSFSTDTTSLLRMLHRQTDLPESVLEKFENTLTAKSNARLLAVELNDQILTQIGYFVD